MFTSLEFKTTWNCLFFNEQLHYVFKFIQIVKLLTMHSIILQHFLHISHPTNLIIKCTLETYEICLPVCIANDA